MEATSMITGHRSDLSAAMGKANNVDFSMFTATNYMMSRPPEYFVFIYNVSKETYKVERPPLFKSVTVPGREGKNRYALAGRVPQPFMAPKGNVDSNEVDMIPTDARRIAMDIINPDNTGINQDGYIDPKNITAIGNNLGAKGVFYSLNGPGGSKFGQQEEPTKEEIDRAYDRMEKYYRFKLDEAKTMAVTDPANLGKLLGPEHHAAAEYFGEEYAWHAKTTRPMDCPNCGEKIKAGAAFHKTDEGVFCIIDWRRAVASGIRTRQQAFEATEDTQFAPKVVDAPVATVPATPQKEQNKN